MDCGEADPYVLTFDHVRGSKKMNISQMVNQGYRLEVIQNEIDKCVVRLSVDVVGSNVEADDCLPLLFFPKKQPQISRIFTDCF